MATLTPNPGFPQKSHLHCPEAPWRLRPEVIRNSSPKPGYNYHEYELLQGDNEYTFVEEYFNQSRPIANRTIQRVICIHHPVNQEVFEANLKKMEQSASIEDTPGNEIMWKSPAEVAKRKWALDRWKALAGGEYSSATIKHSDSHQVKVDYAKVFPLWHGTKASLVEKICDGGFKYFGKHNTPSSGTASSNTDPGFFGSGVYFTNSAKYAADSYSKDPQGNCLFLAWVAMKEPYPVISDIDWRTSPGSKPYDMQILPEKGALGGRDAHYIPVVSTNPSAIDWDIYYPCLDGVHSPVWDEYVVFETPQTLVGYLVIIGVDLPMTISANAQLLRTDMLAHCLLQTVGPGVAQTRHFQETFIHIVDNLSGITSADVFAGNAVTNRVCAVAMNVFATMDSVEVKKQVKIAFVGTPEAILKDLMARIEVFRDAVKLFSSKAKNEQESAVMRANFELAMRKTSQSMAFNQGFNVLDAIHSALEAAITENKLVVTEQARDLAQKKASDQSVELAKEKSGRAADKQKHQEEVGNYQQEALKHQTKILEEVKKRTALADQLRASELLAAQMATSSNATLPLQRPVDIVALKQRIDAMGFKCTEDHRSPAFKQEITHRIETMRRISDFLQPFDGLLQNGPTGRRTSFVQENATFTLAEIQELLTEYRRAFNPVLAAEGSFLENLVFMKGAHGVISDVVVRDKRNSYPITTRLGLEHNDGYLDIFSAEAMEENNIWGDLMKLSQKNDAFLLDVFRNKLKKHLRLTIPRRDDGSIDWDKKEDYWLSTKTFKDKFLEIVSKTLALKWVEQNNELLQDYLDSLGRSA